MQHIELLESLVREIVIDAPNMEDEIKKVVDIDHLSKVIEKRVIAAMNTSIEGGAAYEQAIRIGAAYYEAFMLGYRFRSETVLH